MKRQLLTAILASLILMGCGRYPKPTLIPSIPYTPDNIALVEKTLLSVGHITGKTEEDGQIRSYGCTAFSIDVRKWMTAAHCVGLDMLIDGHPAMVIAASKEMDLAVLVADYVRPALHIRVKPLVRQEEVIALGYGMSWKFPTITHHFVMMLNYSPYDDIYPGTWYSNGFIGGQSGGPIIDLTGQVVGVIQRGDSQVGYGVNAAAILAFEQSTVVILD